MSKSKGVVQFKAIGRPSALKINGNGEGPKGVFTIEDKTLSGNATFTLESLDTGIKLRNEHMKKKYLETDKYPEAKFSFTKVALPENINEESAKIDKVSFEGVLTLHGVEKTVNGTSKIERNGSSISVNAEFGIKLSDFGIGIPSFAGITVAETVDVLVEFKGPLEKSAMDLKQ